MPCVTQIPSTLYRLCSTFVIPERAPNPVKHLTVSSVPRGAKEMVQGLSHFFDGKTIERPQLLQSYMEEIFNLMLLIR